MSKYVLIHGAWHAAWCWSKTVPILERAGHQVLNINLPGRNIPSAEMKSISLKTHVDHVAKIIRQVDGQVVLVGHSMAGVVISQLAELMPDKIKQLVYVCAFVPKNGESLSDTAKKSDTPGVSTEMDVDIENNSIKLRKTSKLVDLFFGKCSAADKIDAMKLLNIEPFQPFIDPITITDGNFGRVPKLYIECSHDKALLPKDQKRMYSWLNCNVVRIDADHSPFLSAPTLLGDIILTNTMTYKNGTSIAPRAST